MVLATSPHLDRAAPRRASPGRAALRDGRPAHPLCPPPAARLPWGHGRRRLDAGARHRRQHRRLQRRRRGAPPAVAVSRTWRARVDLERPRSRGPTDDGRRRGVRGLPWTGARVRGARGIRHDDEDRERPSGRRGSVRRPRHVEPVPAARRRSGPRTDVRPRRRGPGRENGAARARILAVAFWRRPGRGRAGDRAQRRAAHHRRRHAGRVRAAESIDRRPNAGDLPARRAAGQSRPEPRRSRTAGHRPALAGDLPGTGARRARPRGRRGRAPLPGDQPRPADHDGAARRRRHARRTVVAPGHPRDRRVGRPDCVAQRREPAAGARAGPAARSRRPRGARRAPRRHHRRVPDPRIDAGGARRRRRPGRRVVASRSAGCRGARLDPATDRTGAQPSRPRRFGARRRLPPG